MNFEDIDDKDIEDIIASVGCYGERVSPKKLIQLLKFRINEESKILGAHSLRIGSNLLNTNLGENLNNNELVRDAQEDLEQLSKASANLDFYLKLFMDLSEELEFYEVRKYRTKSSAIYTIADKRDGVISYFNICPDEDINCRDDSLKGMYI
ncbi:MAG: hypothetical protein PHW96_01965 [Candidatus Nanoarchaeia archaeon]|nr:hypothetical protein [Candidatus Nanoarchaeia archaeon]